MFDPKLNAGAAGAFGLGPPKTPVVPPKAGCCVAPKLNGDAVLEGPPNAVAGLGAGVLESLLAPNISAGSTVAA